MGSTQYPNFPRTRYLVTLTSGTSYTVPTNVTYLNVTLRGGGGGGGAGMTLASGTPLTYGLGHDGFGGQVVSSTLAVSSGASISYAIGAGGAGDATGGSGGGTGGTTTFTGATSATGGLGGSHSGNAGKAGTDYLTAGNGGSGGVSSSSGAQAGGAGGAGSIDVEYWL